MPKLAFQAAPTTETVSFVFSPSLDLLNSMYFTSLVETSEGVEGWPVLLRRQMDPALLEELDFLYNYPAGNPGIAGTLGDLVFAHPELWDDTEALVRFVREMPDGLGESETSPGIQGLIYNTTFKYLSDAERAPFEKMPHREAILARIGSLDDRDAEAAAAWYDRPAELRERLARLIERFFEDHYQRELPGRREALERSAAAHRGSTREQAIAAVSKLSNRPTLCLEEVCPGPYDRLIFAPSLDMGPYMSCADFEKPSLHAMFYPCEPEFAGAEGEAAEAQNMARIYKALGDEQRLRILHMLRGGEMYAQEIVDRIGLHQSVVSRHLSFLKAVGLLNVRKHNSMKYYSLNAGITGQLATTIDLFAGASARED
jgi:DNA-binding transcriptional ArsR family regulator